MQIMFSSMLEEMIFESFTSYRISVVQFGCSLVIGEEFMDATTNLQFKTLDSSFPWIRAACLAAQLTSPQATDGIAKLLNKSDLEKLKHMKGNVVTVAKSTMAYGWKVLQQA
jgi:hypothetical protein